MHLQEYFRNQQDSHISEAQKFSVYKKIIEKKSSKSYFRQRSFLHTRSLVYGLSLTVIVMFVYGAFFMDSSPIYTNKYFGSGGILIEPKPIQSVDAGYIANIVDFVGGFHIEHNGEEIQSSNIHDGDTVVLDKDTKLIFHTNENTQMEVVGPAKFVLHSDDTSYKMELIYGDFVEVQSLTEETKKEIEIYTEDLVVSQEKSSVSSHFQIINQGGTHLVKNTGKQQLSVKTAENEIKVTTSQLAEIDNSDISVMDMEEFDIALKEQNIGQKFTWKSTSKDAANEVNSQENDDNTHQLTGISLETILSTPDSQIDADVAEELGITNSTEKRLLSLEDNNKLHGLLQSSFIQKDFDKLKLHASNKSSREFLIAYNNLEYRIQQLYQLFDLNYSSTQGDMSLLSTRISYLVDYISTNYLLPPTYIDTLFGIIKEIDVFLRDTTSQIDVVNSGEVS